MTTKYHFKQHNNLWGLIDKKTKNWAVKPIYNEAINIIDEELSCLNAFIFKKDNLYFIYTLELESLYPDGVLDYDDCRQDCNIDSDNNNEYCFRVKGTNDLYGVSYRYTVFYNNDSRIFENHIKTEWERIYAIDEYGCVLIKNDDLYFLSHYHGKSDIYVYNYRQFEVTPRVYYDFIQKNRDISLPLCKEKMTDTRFFAIANYCSYVLNNYEKTIPEYAEVLEWMKPYKKKGEITGLFEWLSLELFAENYEGNKIPKKYKRH